MARPPSRRSSRAPRWAQPLLVRENPRPRFPTSVSRRCPRAPGGGANPDSDSFCSRVEARPGRIRQQRARRLTGSAVLAREERTAVLVPFAEVGASGERYRAPADAPESFVGRAEGAPPVRAGELRRIDHSSAGGAAST